jgi:hypothetical protein
MKLIDSLILSGALALIVIGLHQTWTVGVQGSYFIFMFAVGLLFWFQLRRNQDPTPPKEIEPKPKRKKKS